MQNVWTFQWGAPNTATERTRDIINQDESLSPSSNLSPKF